MSVLSCPVLSTKTTLFTTTTMTDMTRPPRSLWPLWLWTPEWPWRTWGICSLFEAVGGCSQGSCNGGCLKTVKRPNGQLWPTACHTYSESYWSDDWFGTRGGNCYAKKYALCSMKWFENDPHLVFLAQQIKLRHKSVSAQEGQLQLCQSHN